MYADEEGDINIQVVGYQWKWEYKYLEDNVNFFSNLTTDQDEIYNQVPKGENYLLEVDEPVVIPTGKRIRFLITANDVIHSWWMPDFAIKQDAIPGFPIQLGQLLKSLAFIEGSVQNYAEESWFYAVVVKVVTPEEYELWVAEKKEAYQLALLTEKEWSLSELMLKGEEVYAKNCVACHQTNGMGIQGIFPKLAGSEIVLNNKSRNVEILMEGVQGAAMQSLLINFQK